MPSPSLDWLDLLPDLRVPGVTGVPPQKPEGFAGTPAKSQDVTSVPQPRLVHAAHVDTPQGVPHKTAEKRHVTPGTPGTPQSWIALGKLPEPIGGWARKLAALDPANAPPCLLHDRWRELLADADALLRHWGEKAIALGWADADLFSVPPGPERWGRGGLAMALSGRPVIAMTAEAATIENPHGPPARYYRRPKPGSVAMVGAGV